MGSRYRGPFEDQRFPIPGFIQVPQGERGPEGSDRRGWIGLSRVSIGCSPLDDLIGGGIESSAITQLFGEGGSGKTNICLQLTRNVVLSGHKVIYIDTEGVSMERFIQICGGDEDHKRISREVLFFQSMNSDQLQESITNTVKLASKDLHIGLVVVDSATVFYRLNLGTKRFEENRREIAKVLMDLMGIARKQDIPILITTQVYGGSAEGEVKPIGGYSLAHNCKAIVRLEKLGERGRRRATLIKHRSMPSGGAADFQLTGRGIEDVVDDDLF